MPQFARFSRKRLSSLFVKREGHRSDEPKAPPKELVESIEKYSTILVLCVAIAAYAIMRSMNDDRAEDAMIYAEKALAAIHSVQYFDNLPHRAATIKDSGLFQQRDIPVFTERQYCNSNYSNLLPDLVETCKAWDLELKKQEDSFPAGRIFLVDVQSQLNSNCVSAIINGPEDHSEKVMNPHDPMFSTENVVGSRNHLVIVSCGSNYHKEAFIVVDGRDNKLPIYLFVEADKYHLLMNAPASMFRTSRDPSCVNMTDPYRSEIPSVYTGVLGWTRTCYIGDAASLLKDFERRYLATALQTPIPPGDADKTLAFARDNFMESSRSLEFDFSSLKVDFRYAVVINCIIACFICYILYIRSERIRYFISQSTYPSVLLDHDLIMAGIVSVISLIFICIAPIVCLISVVMFNKVGFVIFGQKSLVDFVDRTICTPLGTSCAFDQIATISVTRTTAACAGVLSEIFMILAVFNFLKYIARARKFARKAQRLAAVRSKFSGPV